MNFTDFLIIYLACGAPFAVYYFLRNREIRALNRLWLETFLIFIFWIPSAFSLLRNKKTYRAKFSFANPFSVESLYQKLSLIQKQLEEILKQSNFNISVFEFREIIERYVGLTLAKQSYDQRETFAEKEFYRVCESENAELAAVCLHRRNRKRLFFHQTLAGRDFYTFIVKLSDIDSQRKKLGVLSIEFVTLLNDLDILAGLEEVFGETSQSEEDNAVPLLERDLWNTETQKPSSNSLISTRPQILTATTNSRGKD